MKRIITFLIFITSLRGYAGFFETNDDTSKRFVSIASSSLSAGCHGGSMISSCEVKIDDVVIAKDYGMFFPDLPNLNALRLASIVASHQKRTLDLYLSNEDNDLVVATLNNETLANSIFNEDTIEIFNIDPDRYEIKRGGTDIYLYGVRLNIKNKYQLIDLVKLAKDLKRKISMIFYSNNIRVPDFHML